MSSLNANKVKINMCFVSIKLSLLLALFIGATVSNLYSNNYNNYCLFGVLLTQLFAIQLTTKIFKPRLFYSHPTRLHTRLTELLLPVVCFAWPLYSPKQTVWRMFLKWNVRVLAFSRTLLRPHCCLCILFTFFCSFCLLF